MEFDELKRIWRQQPPLKVREDEIAAILKRRSNSIVSVLKRTAWFELLLTAIVGCILLFYSVTTPPGALKWSYVFLVVLFAGFIIYYLRKIAILSRVAYTESDIKTNIERLVASLKVYLKFYRNASSILYPFCFFLMLALVVAEHGLESFLALLSQPHILIYLGMVLLFVLAGSLWLTRWFVNKLYGKHLEKLERLLDDLHASNSIE